MSMAGFVPLVSLRKLEYLLGRKREDIRRMAQNAESYYKPFEKINSKTGKVRTIDNPLRKIKKVQSLIKSRILDLVPLPAAMIGGVKGKCIRDNMQPHVGAKLVTCLDIRDCFPSIDSAMVYRVFFTQLGCSSDIAQVLTKLTTYQGKLPQGAPTSPKLASLAMTPLAEAIGAILKPLGLKYTIWMDDITISGPDHRHAIDPIIKLIRSYGFGVRNKKIKIMSRSGCQLITGGVINRGLSIGKLRRSEYRRFISSSDPESDVDRQRVRSRLSFVRSINPAQERSLSRLWNHHLNKPEQRER